MSKKSPTQRTLEWLRKQGYTAAVVERWNAYAKIRQDLFGFIDVVAIHSDHEGVLGVQATSGTNTSSRLNKVLETPLARLWCETGNRLWVVGWRQLVKKNKDGSKPKVKQWSPDIREVNLADF